MIIDKRYPIHCRIMFIIGMLLIVSCNGQSDSNSNTWIEPKTGMEFVWIPAGTFTMGTPDTETPQYKDGKPLHSVTLSKGFWMSKYEVTQGQWMKVMGSNPSWFDLGDDYPVEVVSWNDCQEFITRLEALSPGNDFSLPSEGQWEYACRANTNTPFYSGDCLSSAEANYDGENPYSGCAAGLYEEKTKPVGSFPPNGFGLYDMAGNVAEWCEDWYDSGYYSSSPLVDPLCENNASGRHVVRGGGWFNFAKSCRSGYRNKATSQFRYYIIGLRLVRYSRG